MVETILKGRTLPEDFAQRLLRYPFPRHEPEVEIVDLPGERLRVRCTDAQSHFVPLVPDGRCDWTFYDWPGARLTAPGGRPTAPGGRLTAPGGRLTGVYECAVISSARWKSGMLLREWRRYTDLEEEVQEWREDYFLVDEDAYRWVEVQRGERGVLDISTYHYPDGQASEPGPMALYVGLTWGERERTRVLGVSRVRVGERTWKCLKVALVSDQGQRAEDTPTVLAEWYVAESGRTVFFRRYNAPGWREPGQAGSFEALEGNLEVEYEGVRYRHWYDCIPDHALESALT